MFFNLFNNKNKSSSENQTNLENNEDNNKDFWNISFNNLKNVVSNTANSLVDNVVNKFKNTEEIDEFFFDDLEDTLIKADLGVDVSSEICDNLKKKNNLDVTQVREFLKQIFSEILDKTESNELSYKENELNIYFITGVNGAGKTTLIGKLANNFINSGKKVLIAAGDTFRAAAEEQLDIWAKRSGADIVRKDGADSASVVFDAIKKAQNENFDVLLIDTAGRLQNKSNLMQELAKIKSVIDKNAPNNLRESMLVIDATTGQNGLSQAKIFTDCVKLTSVALTKLDGTAKGGIIFSIAEKFSLPVKLIGVGEKIDDLKLFNKNDFITAIF